MDKQIKHIEFISFCIEMYADQHHSSGQDVIARFDAFGVLDYLAENYEVLHTQGFGYILPLVDDYIAKQELQV